MTIMETEEIVQTRIGDETTDGPCAHIIFVPKALRKSMTAAQYMTKAQIEGITVMALCGKRWIPSRNPTPLPVCSKCLEIYRNGGGEDLPDA